MAIDVRQSFTGRGEIFKGDLALPVTVTGSYAIQGNDPVQCTVVIETAGLPPDLLSRLHVDEHSFQLRGTTAFGEQFLIPTFRTHKATFTHSPYERVSYEDNVDLFILGQLEDFDASAGTLTCSVSFPPTAALEATDHHVPLGDAGTVVFYSPELFGLLEHGASREGEGQRVPLDAIYRKSRGIRWQTHLGEAELRIRYDFIFDQSVGLDPALTRVRKHEITIEINRRGVVSLGAILDELPEALDEALWLLPLLGHRRLLWYSAEIYFHPHDSATAIPRRALARRRQVMPLQNYGHDSLLIRPQALSEGVFEALCRNLASSPFRDLIRHTIPYLLITHEHGGGYIEPRLAVCYSALEGLVDRLGDEHGITTILANSDAKRLAKGLRKVIREAVPEQDRAGEVIDKLGELGRRAFLPRLIWLLAYYRVDAAKLWPAGTDMAAEWKQWIKRRNAFVHKAKTLDDDPNLLGDFDRLRYLIELWLLKLLDCPDSALDFAHLGTYGPLDRNPILPTGE